jgi:hypothetical protein
VDFFEFTAQRLKSNGQRRTLRFSRMIRLLRSLNQPKELMMRVEKEPAWHYAGQALLLWIHL